MNVETAIFLPEENYHRQSVCIALVGSREVSIKWAIRAMSIKFPPNCMRAILSYPHQNLDLSRNISIKEWLNSPIDMRTDWVALIAAESKVRWDVVVDCVSKGDKFSKIGESYIIHRDCFGKAPWFVDGKWTGINEVALRDDLLEEYDKHQPLTTALPMSATAAKKLIAVCIPTLGTTSMLWVSHAIQLSAPLASSTTTVVALGQEVGQARENLINGVLSMNPRPEFVLFYGDDNLPRCDAVTLLFETMQKTGEDVVAGLYYMKNSPPDIPIMWRNDKAGPMQPGIDFNVGDSVRVDGTGLDFALFKTSAFEKIKRPRFKTLVKYVPGYGMVVQTEDAYFWQRWLDTYNKGPLVDTRCRVGHYSHVNGMVYGV